MVSPIILASASSARRQMLAQAGITFKTRVARIDEESVKSSLMAEKALPKDIADTLAEMKAARVASQNPGAVVIGSDQVLDLDGLVLSKPVNLAQARAQLVQLRNRQHKLISAAVIYQNNIPIWRHAGETTLWMRDFSDLYLDQYLERTGAELFQTVGGYKLESEGVRLFSRIQGDYFNVLGMPLVEILNYLSASGIIEE